MDDVKHLFFMILKQYILTYNLVSGTLFLWMFWPSFNAALAQGDDQHRAVLNTYYALCACTIVAMACSALVDEEEKFHTVSILPHTVIISCIQ